MHTDFWIEKWQQRQIGFHEGRPNPSLQQWFHAMNLQAGDHVVVPLCGKSQDMLWLLGQGLRVTGIECSPLAVQEFLDENNLTPQAVETDEATDLIRHHCEELTLWQGDFFSLPGQVLASADGVYDRAALIALPEELRRAYVEKFRNELVPDTPILLVTLDFQRDPDRCNGYQGPPFPLNDEMVCSQYQGFTTVEKLGERDILAEEPKFREQGATSVYEKTWLIRK